MERWIERKRPFTGSIFAVTSGTAQLDDGQTVRRDVVEHHGGAAVVAIVDGKVLFVRQFRIAVDEAVLELPAGKLDGVENPEQRAHIELEEETGYRAGKMEQIAHFYTSPGYSTEALWVYRATELEKTAQNLEFDEDIELLFIPVDEVKRRLRAGEFKDAKTLIGLLTVLGV